MTGASLLGISVTVGVPKDNLRSILKFQLPGPNLRNSDSERQAYDQESGMVPR